MSISIIGTVGVPACYGGFESLVENLLPSEKIDLIYCSKKVYKKQPSNYKNTELYYINLDANGIQSIFYDIYCILHTIFRTKNDLLILGVSGAIILPITRLLSKRKIVTNIDGLEWKRDKWGKYAKRFLKFSELLAVKYSDIIIADNQAIADYVKKEYGSNPEVIAYGGNHALISNVDIHLVNKQDYSLALCRIEPENNIQLILEAFSRVPYRKLVFIGNWNKSEYGIKLKEQYEKYKNITIEDPIYDIKRLFEYRSTCNSYIHGHSAGGTNPSLVEMMFFGVPIISFDCSYNRATTENKSLYFKNVDKLVDIIKNNVDINCLSGLDMLKIANRRYTWDIVKKQYLDLFN